MLARVVEFFLPHNYSLFFPLLLRLLTQDFSAVAQKTKVFHCLTALLGLGVVMPISKDVHLCLSISQWILLPLTPNCQAWRPSLF